MIFNNPRFKPRPLYIKGCTDTKENQKSIDIYYINPLEEDYVLNTYSALINELVDLTIAAVIDHFLLTARKESLVEKYTEELLNDLEATKIYYDGQDIAGHPLFEIRIKFSKKLEKHWNTYTCCLMRIGRNKSHLPIPIYYRKYLKGNNYMTLRFTYETGSNWYRFQMHKVKTVCVPDEDNVKVHFVVWKEDRPEAPYHKVREVISCHGLESYQVWNSNMSAKVYLG